MYGSLSAAGRAALRTILSSVIVFGIGVSEAPDLNRTYLLGVSLLVAVIAAGARFLQAYLTWATLVSLLGEPYGDWADSFVQGFLGSLIVTLTGWQGSPDLSTAKAFVVAAIVGAVNAGVRALQGLLTVEEAPNRGRGLREPKARPPGRETLTADTSNGRGR